MLKRAALVLAIFLLALPAGATSPKQVTLDYNRGTKTLTVTADHYTFAPTMHFVKTIEVEVDGVKVTTKTMTGQTNNNQQIVKIPLPDVKPGAKITVTCYCSLFGSKSAEITAP